MPMQQKNLENLLGQMYGAETAAPSAVAGVAKAGGRNLLKNVGGTILGAMVLQRLMRLPGEFGERKVQREAIQSQASMATPENLYLQAALPQAQEEESMARQALYSQLTGGVLGPTLARGERLIG